MFYCYLNLQACIFQISPMVKTKIITIIQNVGSYLNRITMSPSKR